MTGTDDTLLWIDSVLGPDGVESVGSTFTTEGNMSFAAIMAIVLEVLKQRAAAGWPLLKMLLDYFGNKVQADADADTATFIVGAAPQEIKDQIIAWLEKQKATAGVGMKFVYTMLVRFVPLVADNIWDSLFKAGHVSKPLSSVPKTMQAADDDEQTICEDVMAA